MFLSLAAMQEAESCVSAHVNENKADGLEARVIDLETDNETLWQFCCGLQIAKTAEELLSALHLRLTKTACSLGESALLSLKTRLSTVPASGPVISKLPRSSLRSRIDIRAARGSLGWEDVEISSRRGFQTSSKMDGWTRIQSRR